MWAEVLGLSPICQVEREREPSCGVRPAGSRSPPYFVEELDRTQSPFPSLSSADSFGGSGKERREGWGVFK